MQTFTAVTHLCSCVTALLWQCSVPASAVEEPSADAQPAAGHAQPPAPPITQAAWQGADAEQKQESAADLPHQQPQAQPSTPSQLKKKKSKPTVPFAGEAASVHKLLQAMH